MVDTVGTYTVHTSLVFSSLRRTDLTADAYALASPSSPARVRTTRSSDRACVARLFACDAGTSGHRATIQREFVAPIAARLGGGFEHRFDVLLLHVAHG